jgi:hypothetical protein
MLGTVPILHPMSLHHVPQRSQRTSGSAEDATIYFVEPKN